MPPASAADRIRRILVMVPWVMAHPGCTVTEVCERFGMTREELTADFDTLLVCGLPPFTPADLIEAFIDGEQVEIRMADYLARPPRLSRSEAIALLVMGRAVAQLPGFEEAGSLRSALEKLRGAIAPHDAEQARALTEVVDVDLNTTGVESLPDLRSAIRERARLRIQYWSAGRGEMSEREVDPLLVFAAGGNWYLAAHDHHSGEERLFRVDRIKEAARTGSTFEAPEGFDERRFEDPALFTPSSSDIEVAVDVWPGASWLRESVPYERADELAGGKVRLHLRTAHTGWLIGSLLTAGADARAVSPQDLVEQVRAAAQRTLALYRP